MDGFSGQRGAARVEMVEVKNDYELYAVTMGWDVPDKLTEYVRWLGPLSVPALPAGVEPTEYPDHLLTPRVWAREEPSEPRRDPELEFIAP